MTQDKSGKFWKSPIFGKPGRFSGKSGKFVVTLGSYNKLTTRIVAALGLKIPIIVAAAII